MEGTWEIAWKRNRFCSAGKQDFLFSIFTPFSPHTLLRVGCASCLFYSSAPRMHFHWTRPNPAQEQGVELGDRAHVKHSRLPSTKKKKKNQNMGQLRSISEGFRGLSLTHHCLSLEQLLCACFTLGRCESAEGQDLGCNLCLLLIYRPVD